MSITKVGAYPRGVEYFVAAERSQIVRSKGLRPGRRIQPPGQRVPGGISHAVKAGSSETACGLQVSSLVTFPEQDFVVGFLDRCAPCRRAIDAD